MDKQSILGFVLIGIVLIVWMWVQAPPPQPAHPAAADSVAHARVVVPETARVAPISSPMGQRSGGLVVAPDSLGAFFTQRLKGPEKVLVIKTDLYTAEVSTHGGLIRKWELHEYKTWDQNPVQ